MHGHPGDKEKTDTSAASLHAGIHHILPQNYGAFYLFLPQRRTPIYFL